MYNVLIEHGFSLEVRHKVMHRGLILPVNITLSTQVYIQHGKKPRDDLFRE